MDRGEPVLFFGDVLLDHCENGLSGSVFLDQLFYLCAILVDGDGGQAQDLRAAVVDAVLDDLVGFLGDFLLVFADDDVHLVNTFASFLGD